MIIEGVADRPMWSKYVQDCEGTAFTVFKAAVSYLIYWAYKLWGHSFDWPFDGHPEVTGYLSGDK